MIDVGRHRSLEIILLASEGKNFLLTLDSDCLESYHVLFEISACYVFYEVANFVPPSFLSSVLYDPDSFLILRVFQ